MLAMSPPATESLARSAMTLENPATLHLPCSSSSSASQQQASLPPAPRRSGAPIEVLDALTAIGARPLEEYLSELEANVRKRRGIQSNKTILSTQEDSSIIVRKIQSSFDHDDGILITREDPEEEKDPSRMAEEDDLTFGIHIDATDSPSPLIEASSPPASPSPPSSLQPTIMSSPKRPRDITPPPNPNPLSLLTVSPSSRLGKKLCYTRTGQISEVIAIEAAIAAGKEPANHLLLGGAGGPTSGGGGGGGGRPGRFAAIASAFTGNVVKGQAVSQLYTLAQQAGLPSPTFHTQSMIGLHCSPDHFVTLTFEGHTFSDELGQRTIKAGKEIVAQKALNYFLGNVNEANPVGALNRPLRELKITSSEEEEEGKDLLPDSDFPCLSTQVSSPTTSTSTLSSSSSSSSSSLTKSPATSPTSTSTSTSNLARVPQCINPIGILYEHAQRRAHPPPEFTFKVVKGTRCSPDYFVTLTFLGHTFSDEIGQTSLKAGKEKVALAAWRSLLAAASK